MATRSSTLSERSPVSVMRWDDSSTICTQETKPKGSMAPPEQKSIRISERHEIFEIPHLNDWPDEDFDNVWYSSKDYADIKADYQTTIFLMEAGKPLVDDHCSRGLEYRTQEGGWARYQNKRDAYNAVLDEQDRQWKVDKDDFEKMREIYLEHSTKCAQAAVVRALHDKNDAHEEGTSSSSTEPEAGAPQA